MRGTSGIAIGEVADMVREIMVRNVVLGYCGSPGGLAPPGSAGRLAPPCGRDGAQPSRCWPRRHRRGIFEPQRGDF